MTRQGNRSDGGTLIAWDPSRYLRTVEPVEARLSRGFLRCRAEKWFPAFATHWLPLHHSLGLEVRLTEVKPQLASAVPRSLDKFFLGSVDDEPMAVGIDSDSARNLLEEFSPGSYAKAQDVLLEYLARRLFTSLSLSWSGPESSVVRYEPEMDIGQLQSAGAVKLGVSINGNLCTVWFLLGRRLVERLDGLWRRQVHSAAKQSSAAVDVRFEVVQLGVPPTMLADYVRPETVVDLEIRAGDTVTLRVGNKPWLPARLCNVNGNFGFEILPGPVAPLSLPEGMTRLSVEFGMMQLDGAQLSEVSQVGAVLTTPIPVSDQVHLVINGEEVGRAVLCAYEGRFAMCVQ